MAQGLVQVNVQQATYDVMQQLAKLVAAVKASGGFSLAATPAEVGALVAALPALVADVGQLGAEVADSKLLVAKSAALGAFDIAAALGV